MVVAKNTRNSYHEHENLIGQLSGVVAARIIPDMSGQIAEIHVLANSSRAPKQLVRDIESALTAKFGLIIDHKKISVAQLQEESTQKSGTFSVCIRPNLASVAVLTTGRNMEAKVLLEINGMFFEGGVSGVRTTSNRLRLIAQAALCALENYMRGICTFIMEEVSVIKVCGEPVVIVSVTIATNDGDERLVGTAFIHNDETQAVAKATLAAVNRRLSVIK